MKRLCQNSVPINPFTMYSVKSWGFSVIGRLLPVFISIIIFLALTFTVQIAEAAPLVAYSKDSAYDIFYSTYGASSWDTEANGIDEDSYHWWVVGKTHPNKDEQVAVFVETGAIPHLFASLWDGTNWDDGSGSPFGDANDLGTVYVDDYRCFDAAYEQSSGHLLVVAASGSGGRINYWTWDGTSWTGPTEYNVIDSDRYNWIKLAAKPGTDEIAVILADEGSDVTGLIWDGSSFNNKLQLSTSLSSTTTEAVSVAYEQTGATKEAIFVWGQADDVWSKRWDGTWISGNPTVSNVITGTVGWLRLKADSATDDLLLGVEDNATSSPDMDVAEWDGSAWSTPKITSNPTLFGNAANHRAFDVIYDDSNKATVVFSTTVGTEYRNEDAWSTDQTDISSSEAYWVQLDRDGDSTVHLAFHEATSGSDDLETYIYTTSGGWVSKGTVSTANDLEDNGNTRRVEPFALTAEKTATAPATYYTPVSAVDPGWSNHRKRVVFYNGDRFFLLYSKGDGSIYYKSSTDNVSWSGESTLANIDYASLFDIYLVNDTKFDLIYYRSVNQTRYVRTCTISGGTITVGGSSVGITNTLTNIAVARSGTGDRIYVIVTNGSDLWVSSANNTGDAVNIASWSSCINDSKAASTAVAIVPYQSSDEALVVYTRDEGGNTKDGLFSSVVSPGNGGTEVQISNYDALPDFSSPVSISDTDFRIIVKNPTSGAMEEWRWNDTSWTQIDANIDPENETDQESPSLFYDRLSGDMYVFSVDTSTDDVERHYKPNGGAWQTEVIADNGESSTTHTYPITQMHEPPYGSSRTCNELVWAYRTTGYDLHVGSETLTACADTDPPTPDPMTFATPPDQVDTTTIDMTATTATDPSTPVEYLFTFTSCGSNGGTGGSDSSWQTTTTYTDSGLEPNKCYGYTVTARDSATPTPNTGTASAVSEAYTSANVPGTPTLSNATSITLDLTNDENGNPASSPTTLFAVQVVTTTDGTWLNQYVDANGDPSATAVWMSDATLDGLKLRGLQPSTLYGVKVKARNQDGDETVLSAEGQGTTTAPGPYLEQIHYRWFNDDGAEGAASWAAPEDSPLSSVAGSSPIRLRVEVSNEGPADDPGPTTYLLEYATSTAGPWTPIELAGVATNSHWQMVDSSYYTDGDSSTNIDPGLTDENGSFLAGKLKDTSNLTVDLPLTTTQFTEIEYCLQATSKATPGVTYYFRLTDDGTDLHDYPQYGQVTLDGGGSWLNSNWLYRKHLRIDSSRVAGNLTNFPVLISTTDLDWRDNLNSGHVAQSDGGDILFTAGDGVTKLDHEIEKYEPSTGELVAWVEIPSLSGSADTNLYIYYGNSSLAEGDNQWNVKGTWDEGGSDNYKGVWHLNEPVTDEQTGGVHSDSTWNYNNGTQNYNGAVTGMIAGAQQFDGTGDYIDVPDSSTLDMGSSQDFTVSAWVKSNQSPEAGKWPAIVRKMNDGAPASDGYGLILFAETSDQWYVEIYDDGPIYTASANGVTDDTWHYVTGVRVGGSLRVYEDGVQIGVDEAASSGDLSNAYPLRMGNGCDSPPSGVLAFQGAIDEVRISKIVRSAEWVQTEYNNQKAPAAFYTVGIEESPGAGADPFNNGWSYRKRMTIDATQISADLTNFPVLISTTDSDLTAAQADFDDIFFTAGNGTMKLDHEIEKYNSSTGELVAWVEVPTVSSTSNTDIYLYYGNATAVDQRNPTGAGVWEPNYVGVWHLRETSGDHAGSTWNYHTGTPQGALNQNTTGPIDGADYFNGTDAYVDVSHDDSLNFGTDDFTVEAWVKSTQAQVLDEYPKILEKLVDSPSKQGYRLVLYSSTVSPYPLFDVWSGGSAEGAEATVDIRDDSWHQVVGVKTSGEVRIYVDGASSGSAPHTLGTTSSTSDLYFGRSVPWDSDYFEGSIDEVRISKIARPAAWTEAQYNNVSNPAGFFLTGIEEGPATNGDPFQNGWTYRKRLTIDASRVAADLTNFPVLINTTDADWKEDDSFSGHVAQDDGGDILFTAGDGVTRLYHEIEKYEPSTGELVAWVKVPSLSSSTNTNIYIYYGNSSLGTDENQWNTAGLWATGYKGIYHFAEDPSITTDGDCAGGAYEICDATLNDNDGDMQGVMTSGDLVQAKVGDGLDFDGGDDSFKIKQTNDFDQSVVTVQAWINTSSGAEKRIMMNNTSGTNDWCFTMEENGGSASVLFSNSANADDNQMTTRTLADGQWHHVVAISDPTAANIKIYVDGNLASTATDPSETFGGGDANSPLIAESLTVGTAYFLGKMDEVRVHTGALTAEWIETEYNNQQAPAAFYTVGIEETSGTGADPFNNGWSYRKRITIDSAQVPSDQTNFPVLIETIDPDLIFGGGGHVAQDDGGDMLFTAADGTTKLDHEIEKYVNSTGELVVWVEVRSLSSTSDTDVYLYYGNASAVDQWNPTGGGVWVPNYKGVYHFAEDPSISTDGHCGGGSYEVCDSTSQDNDGDSNGGMLTGDLVPAVIGDGLDFDGNDDNISIKETHDFDAASVSVQAWIKYTSGAEGPIIMNRSSDTTYRWVFTTEDNSGSAILFANGYSSPDERVTTNNTYNDGQWHHVVAISDADPANIQIYIDGVQQTTQEDPDTGEAWGGTGVTRPTIAMNAAFPAIIFQGTMDEVRVHNGAYTADQIQIEYNNQSNPAGFYTIGIEEQPGTVGDPFQNGWTYRKRLTIDASRVAGDLANFPVLISTTDADWIEDSQVPAGHVAQTDGGDIMFTAADGVTKLDHEIEKYDETTGELVAWVEVSSLSGTNNTDIYIYYGNTSLAEGENQWNALGVWDSNYVGVWHLKEDPGPGGAGDIKDSTWNNNDGTAETSMTTDDQVSGQADGSLEFDGTDDYVNAGDDPSLDISGDITLSLWVNPNSYASEPDLLTNGNFDESYSIHIEMGAAKVAFRLNDFRFDSNSSLNMGQWAYITTTRQGSDARIYINGQQDNSDTYGTAIQAAGPLTISSSAYSLDGVIDEVRISSVARSAEWIETQYNNQNSPAAFYTVGIEETTGTGADPFNNGWTYRKRITIDSAQVGCDLTNFPVLISTTDADLATSAQADFDDILFTAADGTTKLDHEIEDYDSGSGNLVAWVEVRSVSSTSDTDIYLYYGNGNAVDQRNPTGAGVWEPNYLGVWHLKETVTDEETTGTHYDSTSNDNDGSQSGNAYDATGQINGAQVFDGTDDYVDAGNDASLVIWNSDFTWQAWAKLDSNSADGDVITKAGDGTTVHAIELRYDFDDDNWQFNGFDDNSSTFKYAKYSQANPEVGRWYHLVGVRDGTTIKIYVDGVEGGVTDTLVTLRDSSPFNLLIGRMLLASDPRYFPGSIDEVRVSRVARDACWIEAEHNNQSNPAGFYTIGLEEQDETDGDPLQNGWTYRKRLTIDASRVAGDLTNFPVLINTIDADWMEDDSYGGHMAQTDGGDIMFTAGDGITKLDHEIEKYDPATGELVAWVEVRSLSGTNNTDIYIYYGNTSLAEGENQWNVAGVWDNGYVGVWHLNETPADGESDGHENSVTNSLHLTPQNINAGAGTTDATGRIAGADDFKENLDYLSANDNPDFTPSGDMTFQAWVKIDTHRIGKIVYKNHNTDPWFSYQMWITDGGHAGSFRPYFQWRGDTLRETKMSSGAMATGSWYHLAGVHSGTDLKLYINGSNDNVANATTSGTLFDSDGAFAVGYDHANGDPIDGIIDEVRISSVARSAEWLQTECNNQKSPAAFYTVGIEETYGTTADPFHNGWQYNKKITILASEVAGDLTNFPVLIKTTDPDWADTLNGGNVAQADGGDILFIAGDGHTKLDHEIERYDETTGELVAWVEVRSLSGSQDTDIYIFYGNANAVDQWNPTGAGVWEPNYVGVWHFNEPVTDEQTTGTHYDSTWNDNAGSQSGNAYNSTGKIAGAQEFDGLDDLINAGSPASLDDLGPMTLSVWINPTSSGAGVTRVVSKDNSGDSGRWFLEIDDTAPEVDAFEFRKEYSSTDLTRVTGNSVITYSDWQYMVVTWDGSDLGAGVHIYKNGGELTPYADTRDGAGGRNSDAASPFIIGNRGTGASPFDGSIDEVRISKIDRSAAWLATEYSNQNDPANFYIVDANECNQSIGLFDNRTPITIHGYQVSGTSGSLTNFPLLVSIENDPELKTIENSGKVFSDGGYDIVFRADDGTTGLDHEVEHYDGVNGTLVAWVRIPSLSKSADTLIYMYFGNCSVTTPSENPEGVWNEYYKGVWHLKENGTGSADDYRDSTQYGNHGEGGDGTPLNNYVPTQVSGKIAYGQDFNNSDTKWDFINCGSDASLDITGNQITLQAWVQYDNASHAHMGPLNHKGWSNGYRLYMPQDSSNLHFQLPGESYDLQTAETLTTGSWHHLVATYDGSRMRIYLDGSKDEYELEKLDNIISNDEETWIGQADQPHDVAWSYPWEGQIDEVRISSIARSADWIKTEYYNQSNPSAFYSIGTDDLSPATAVDLVSFTAQGKGSSVLVEWETAQELKHMGFYLYRAESPWGPFNRLTDKLISGLTFSIVGQKYSFEDKDVTPGEIYYYQLEDLDIYGKKTLHGPICVDWDGDGLPDDWEIAHGLNPGFDDSDLDWDGDGLTNLEEYLRGTDPFNPDTDGDGILDGDEGIVREPDEQAIAGTIGPGVYLVASDETGVTLELQTVSFDFTVVEAEGQEFERLSIKEYIHGFTDEVGKPELPLKGILLDIPQGSGATLTVLETEDEVHTGYRIYPVPEKSVDDQDQLSHVGETFVIDEAAYSVDAFYPDAAALLGKEYLFRGQQKQQIFFFPLTFNPATGELRHLRRIRVRVDYVDAESLEEADLEPQAWAPPVAQESFLDLSSMMEMASWEPPSGASRVYKILISEEGIYRLTRSWLEARSVDVTAIDLSQVRIYNLGQEIAISVYDANGDTRFDPEDYIDFYGTAVEETYAKYTTANVYWLTLEGGVGAPRRMATIDSTPAGASVPFTHTFSLHHEEDRKYWAGAPGSDSLDRYFFDPYLYGEDIAYPGAGDPVSFNLFLPGVSGQGTLTIMMAGTWAPNHQVAVSLNGTSLGTYSWNDIAFYEATIQDVDLVDGNNTVTLECLTGVDAIAVDWFEVTYPRSFQANADTLRFSHETDYLFQVSQFSTNNLLAFDITSPVNVERVTNFKTTGSGPYTLTFEPESASGQRTYLALTSDQVKTPDGIVKDDYGNLANPNIGADYVLITHRDIGWDVNGDTYLWLNDITTFRQAQGLRVKVVDVEDVYDEFTYGIESPEAILDFLAYAYTNWGPPAPQYVLLVGDSTRNPKNNPDPTYGLDSVTTYIPTYLTFTEHNGESATDEWFVRVSGDDAISDLYIGRLPAKNAAEATVMVNKVLAYEQSLNNKAWEKNVLLLADDQREGPEYEYEAMFEIMNDDVEALLPGAMNDPFKGYLNDYFDADDLSAEIIAQINSGALMVNYSGHSSVQILANHRINYENIFNNADVDVLTNNSMYPLFIGMGCLSGNFVFPEDWNFPSLAEALLRGEDKGAAAALMSTGQTTTDGQHILDSALFDAIFNQDIRILGQAVSSAKQTLMANGGSTYEDVYLTFLLFGDPAMTLKVPLPQRPQGLKAQGHPDGVLLSWNAATDCNGDTVAGYNLYRSTTPGGPYTKVNSSLITGTQYDDPTVSSTMAQYSSRSSSSAASGTTYYYVVTSVDSQGDESVHSQETSGGTQSANSSESESSGGGGGGGCFINTVSGD